MFKKIAIITLIRRGSKRFPNKNMYKVADKELYKYTVSAALQLGYEYHVFHDYEDNIKLDERIIQHHRAPEYAGDEHKTNIEIMNAEIGANIYILLQATSPLRDVEAIKEYIKNFLLNDYDIGFLAHKMDNGYYYKVNGDHRRVNFLQYQRTDNGCQKESVYKETGSFYIFKEKQLFKKHLLDTDNYVIYEDRYNIDIDTIEDISKFYKTLIRGGP